MKLPSLSVKRRPAKQPAFRKLFANVRRKKQNVAVAPPVDEIEGDVPNVGVARALVVILIIHVVAIAGIFAHSRWFEKEEAVVLEQQPVIAPARPLRDAGENLPRLALEDDTYIPVAGDSYQKIAIEQGVEEEALRVANNNIEIRPGRILRIPQRTIVAVEPEELRRARQGSTVLETADAMPDEEAAPAPTPVRIDDPLRNAPMVETAAAGSTSGTAVMVTPRVTRPEAAQPAAAPAPAAATPPAAPALTRKYTVKAGDTFWRIAQAHKTTPEVLMKANGISDPRKLKPGMQLSVP